MFAHYLNKYSYKLTLKHNHFACRYHSDYAISQSLRNITTNTKTEQTRKQRVSRFCRNNLWMTMNKRRSKSMDTRFFWLRDRVQQPQFVVEHIPGQYNIADFFTKALPKAK
jgi:hypothetical protein